MKKTVSLILAASTAFGLCSFGARAAEDKIYLYVKSGAKDGDGSMASPLGSLEEARDKVREIKKSGYPEKGICVYFRGGVYTMAKGVDFGAEDSGEEGAPVVYRAYGNEDVRFVGGVELDISEFKDVTDDYGKSAIPKSVAAKVKSINLSDKGIDDVGELSYLGHGMYYMAQIEALSLNQTPAPELIFENNSMTLARYPNDGFMTIDDVVEGGTDVAEYLKAEEKPEIVPMTIRGGGDRLKNWVGAKDPWVFGYWKWDWSDMTMRVASINADSGTFTTDIPSAYLPQKGQRFYAYNLLEELDSPGEYYIDRDTSILYFYPPKASGTAMLTIMDKAFLNMNGAENIEFKSLSMSGSRENGVYMTNCKNITIEHCIIDKTQTVGVFGEYANYNVKLLSNNIQNTGKSAINLVGGDFEKGLPSGNVIENNWIHGFGRLQKTYAYGVMIRGYNTRVSHNKIHNCPHAALGFSGNDHIIEYNEIFDALKQTDDMGAIYTGRAKIDRGTVIRNNYIHDLYTDSTNSAGIFGIYLDDKMDGITIESNVFENIAGSAVFVNGGRDNTVQDNVLINVQNSNFRISAQGVVMGETVEGNLMQYSGMQDGKYKTEPYTKYPHLADILEDEPLYPKYNVFNNNVSVNGATDFFYDLWGRAEKTVVTDRNTMNDTYTYKKDPGFADYAKRNYTIKEDSELMKIEGFKAPDFAGMGLFTEWLSYKLADTVSMKINSPITSNGFDNEYVDNDNIAVTPIIVDNSTYVPIRYLAEALGGDAEFDSEKRIAAINVSGKKAEINLTEGTISVGGTALEGAAAIVRNNRTLVPVRALSEILSKYVEWHDCGIVIISDRETVLDKEKDAELVKELDKRLSNE